MQFSVNFSPTACSLTQAFYAKGIRHQIPGEQSWWRPGPVFSARTCSNPTPSTKGWATARETLENVGCAAGRGTGKSRSPGGGHWATTESPQASSGWGSSPVPQPYLPGCSKPSVTRTLHYQFAQDSGSLYSTEHMNDNASVATQATHSYTFRK